MSECTAAVASVSVTVAPETAGVSARGAACSVPPRGVFFTANTVFASVAAARASSKVITSDVPVTVAELTDGAVVSDDSTVTVTRSASLAVPFARFAPGTGVATSLKWSVPTVAGAANIASAPVAPASVTAPAVTAVSESAPSTWVHCQVTLPPQAPVAVPESATDAPVSTAWSAPALAVGLNGAPLLPSSCSSVSAVSSSKTSSGSTVRELSLRSSSDSAVRPSKTPSGSEARDLLLRFSTCSPVRPAKSPAFRFVETPDVSNGGDSWSMAASWAGVRSAQSMPSTELSAKSTTSTMASRTAGVRSQTSVAATLMSKVSLAVRVPSDAVTVTGPCRRRSPSAFPRTCVCRP